MSTLEAPPTAAEAVPLPLAARPHSLIPLSEHSRDGEQEESAAFRPPFCPNPCCTLHHGPPQPDSPAPARDETENKAEPWYSDHGHYHTRVRGLVQRFRCRHCRRCFSTQSFSTSYYLKAELPLPLLYLCLVGGMSLRALSRTLGCTPASLSNRIARLTRQAITMHRALLADTTLAEDLCADGFVDFTVSRYFPDATTLVAGVDSRMVYAFNHCYLRRRGGMSEQQKRRRAELEQHYRAPAEGERDSLTGALGETLSLSWNRLRPLRLDTDEHPAYLRSVADLALPFPELSDPERFTHRRTSSRAARTGANPLFAVNYLDRQIRLNLASHRRQTVCFGRNTVATLQRTMLLVCYHNYNKAQRIVDTARQPPVHAVAAGVPQGRIERWWRWFFTRRSFFTRAAPTGFLRSLWLQTLETPLNEAAGYLPKHAFA